MSTISYNPGDIGFCRASEGKGRNGATTLLGKLNQAGARVRYPDNPEAWRWTHAFQVVSTEGHITEAIEAGVCETHISKYAGGDFVVVDVKQPQYLRDLAVSSAKDRVGQPYRTSGYLADALQCLTGTKWALDRDGQENCSEHVAYNTLCYVGRYDRKPNSMMPCELAAHYGVHCGELVPSQNIVDTLLNDLVFFVDLFRRHGGDPA